MEQCYICINNKILIRPKPCNHKICYDCYHKLNNCPYCRIEYTKGKPTTTQINIINKLIDLLNQEEINQ